MGTTSRKQREIRQREREFLDIARRMLIDQGYAGLSMDRLAEATEYSKGTVYQHFSTKEDLVTALAVQSMEERLALFDRARKFQGRPRERMLALGAADELFARLHPHHFHSELIIRMANLHERASAERREALLALHGRAIDGIREIVDQAVEERDLKLRPPVTPGDVAYSLFSLAVGSHTLMHTLPQALERLAIAAPFATIRESLHALLDGYGWKPLRSGWDYAATYRRITTEVFADESRRVGLA